MHLRFDLRTEERDARLKANGFRASCRTVTVSAGVTVLVDCCVQQIYVKVNCLNLCATRQRSIGIDLKSNGIMSSTQCRHNGGPYTGKGIKHPYTFLCFRRQKGIETILD